MEVSESPIDQEILESSTANEEIADGEEQKNNGEIKEESNDELNKPQENEIISQLGMEEVPEKTISDKELEEQSQNLNCPPDISGSNAGDSTLFKKGSHDLSQQPLSQEYQKSRQSIGQYSLKSHKSLQQQPGAKENNTKDSRHLISRRTGKELQDNFNQTSLIWEKKPLSEILHPSGKIPQVSNDAKSDVVSVKEDVTPVADAEKELPSTDKSPESFQPVEGEEPPPNQEEPDVGSQLMTVKESGSSLPMPAGESGQGGQQPEKHLEQDGSDLPSEPQSLESKKPFQEQHTNEANAENGAVWISKKTGKEVKSSFNQTSLIWERKPLAQILQRSSTNKSTSRAQQDEDPDVWANWPSPYDY